MVRGRGCMNLASLCTIEILKDELIYFTSTKSARRNVESLYGKKGIVNLKIRKTCCWWIIIRTTAFYMVYLYPATNSIIHIHRNNSNNNDETNVYILNL